MAEIFLEPKEFQDQVDKFATASGAVKEIKYTCDAQGLSLDCMDEYLACIDEFNTTVALFGQLLDSDALALAQFKAAWMRADGEAAAKTFGGIIWKAVAGGDES